MRQILLVMSMATLLLLAIAFIGDDSRATTLQPTGLPTANLLNILWRVKSGSDYLATNDSGERDSLISDGAIYYIPKNNIGGTATFYRLRNGSNTDHMESLTSNEGGYLLEGSLGYAYSSGSAVPGLAQIDRYRKGTADRALGRPNESGSFGALGYSLEVAHSAWGYPRYNHTGISLLSLTAGGVTVESNAVAGGSIWKWTWNNLQFLNSQDYGREMQAAMFFHNGTNYYNPTEAGDSVSGPSLDFQEKHGSPLIQLTNNGSTQSSRSVPLEWNPTYSQFGGGLDHPVIYSDMLEMGKDITLNYNNMGSVARYDTWWNLPGALGTRALDTANDPFVEVPTAYLRGLFRNYWTYDAATDTLTPVTPYHCPLPSPGTTLEYQTNYGGVIISDGSSTSSNALGVYAKNVAVGGSAHRFQLWDLNCIENGGTGSSDYNSSKWSVLYDPSYIQAGYYKLTSWVVSGTVAQVKQKMRDLYLTPPAAMGSVPAISASAKEPFTQVGDGEPGVTQVSDGIQTRTWDAAASHQQIVRVAPHDNQDK